MNLSTVLTRAGKLENWFSLPHRTKEPMTRVLRLETVPFAEKVSAECLLWQIYGGKR